MYETLKRLYDAGKLSDQGLDNAVAKGWISPEQRYEIAPLPEEESPGELPEEDPDQDPEDEPEEIEP